jgi:S1-C subfamily serine protease
VVRRPFLGIAARGEDLDLATAAELGRPRAVRVLGVEQGTPAARGDVRPGDLLVSANGSEVATLDDLQRVMVLAPTPQLALRVLRNGGHRNLTLEPRPHGTPAEPAPAAA